jgi:hypothetical protein
MAKRRCTFRRLRVAVIIACTVCLAPWLFHLTKSFVAQPATTTPDVATHHTLQTTGAVRETRPLQAVQPASDVPRASPPHVPTVIHGSVRPQGTPASMRALPPTRGLPQEPPLSRSDEFGPYGTHRIFEMLHDALAPRDDCQAMSASPQFRYRYCGTLDPEAACASFAVSNATLPAALDYEFTATMCSGGCAVTVLSPERGNVGNRYIRARERVAWCATQSKLRVECSLIEDFERHAGRTDATLLYVDVSASEWQREYSLVSLATRIKAATLFIPLRLTADSLTDPQVTQHLEKLLELYSVQAMHAAAPSVEVQHWSLRAPSEIHLSLRLRTPFVYNATQNHWSIDSYVKRWTGQDLSTMTLPIADPGHIPRRLFTMWKSKKLSRRLLDAWQVWGSDEPLGQVVLDDRECSQLAARFPGLKPRYEALPLNVMRADVCRVLAVYFFGGLYRDLDVLWVRPLKEWFSFDDHVVYGWEDREHLCQWFFAARPGDRCLWSVLQHITNIIANASLTESIVHEAILDLTGAGAWTDAMQGCPTPPKYSAEQMQFTNIDHDQPSSCWGCMRPDWPEALRLHMGWEHAWHWPNLRNYFATRADHHLMPFSQDAPVIAIALVAQSSATFGDPFAFGPQNAFDGSLDTAVETQQQHAPYLDFTFARPVNIGTVVQPDSDHLTCVRAYNRHREPGTASFAEGLSMELFDADGSMIHRVNKERRIADSYLFRLAGMPNRVRRMRLYKNATAVLTFAEVQLYSDHLCRHARRVKVERYEPTSSAELPAVLTMATTLRGRCSSSRAVSPDPSFQYSFCLGNRTASSARDGGQRSVYMVANRTAAVIDGHFVRSMHANGYSVTVLAPTTPKVVQKTPRLMHGQAKHHNRRCRSSRTTHCK